ncbi:triphosphoribosyl-dephospho-CoA synthase MdcB [Stenotrophomonas sp. PSU_St99]
MSAVFQSRLQDANAIDSARLGRLAITSLHAELACAPKPGLVTPFDTGSHDDMDAGTFLRSLFSLRHFFTAIADAGAADAPFAILRAHGMAAEHAMLRATGGINTHRGAIFSLGLLVAAAARCRRQQGHAAPAAQVCLAVQHWADAFATAPLDASSPGQRARLRHGVPGVREQAAAGYPVLRDLAVPSLRHALDNGLPRDAAMCQTLMQLVAQVDDLNLLHRGGADGLAWAQQEARRFIEAGGAFAPGWQLRLHRMGEGFIARRLSPGGSADLLACSWFLLQQEGA